MNQVDRYKKSASEEAIKFIQDGMTVGLGSGSTVNVMLKLLGEHVQAGLKVQGIPSSIETERLANEHGIPITDFTNVDTIDVAIDGADEADPNLNLIKGGGGSLLREKIVDAPARQLIIIVDESKLVKQLGAFPLAVEVVPFGWKLVAKKIADLGAKTQLRKTDTDIFASDNGNYILDCSFQEIHEPAQLHDDLKAMVGVVETGLFAGMADRVIVASEDGIEVKE